MQVQSEGVRNISKEQLLDEKARKWRQFNNKKYSEKKKHGFVEGQKESLPP
jgi:hypothetical protein